MTVSPASPRHAQDLEDNFGRIMTVLDELGSADKE
ncbi:MAG: hypothetical protein ACI8W8_000522 [Rhodothermales bacterium]